MIFVEFVKTRFVNMSINYNTYVSVKAPDCLQFKSALRFIFSTYSADIRARNCEGA